MLAKKSKTRFSSAILIAMAIMALPFSAMADDTFGERFTAEEPSAFSDPASPTSSLDQIEPAAGDDNAEPQQDDTDLEEFIDEEPPVSNEQGTEITL